MNTEIESAKLRAESRRRPREIRFLFYFVPHSTRQDNNTACKPSFFFCYNEKTKKTKHKSESNMDRPIALTGLIVVTCILQNILDQKKIIYIYITKYPV